MLPIWHIAHSYRTPIGGEVLIGSKPVDNAIFVCIHKNAHTWASHLLKTNFNFTTGLLDRSKKFHVTPDKQYIVILRDPIERWVSGFTQYFSKYDPLRAEKLLSNETFQELVFDTLRFDSHTNLQVEYLLNIPVNQCIFFKQEDNLETNLSKFLSTLVEGKEMLPVTDINAYHRRSTNLYKNRLGDKITELVHTNERFMDSLIDYTKPDRELIEFVNRNDFWYNSKS